MRKRLLLLALSAMLAIPFVTSIEPVVHASPPTTLQERVAERMSRRVTAHLARIQVRRNNRIAGATLPLKMQVADAVNMERAKMGLPPLSYNARLETSAQRHADDMHTRDFFAHENPEGERSSDRIKKTGYGVVNAQKCRCSYRVALGENIAKGQMSVAQVITEWLASPKHRDALLSKDYKDIGVGNVGVLWVLNFGGVEMKPGR